MRLFFDTCTIVDYLCNRSNSDNVDKILQIADSNHYQCLMSAGSFYTLTYLLELDLKHKGYTEKEKRVERLREILNGVLSTFIIPELDGMILKKGVNNIFFSDLEDSYQYEAAVKSSCDVFLTDNISDFKYADQRVLKILPPTMETVKYLSVRS